MTFDFYRPSPGPLRRFRFSGTPWSWRWDLNPQPADYKSAALPIELRQRLPLFRRELTHDTVGTRESPQGHEWALPEKARNLILWQPRPGGQAIFVPALPETPF